MNKEAMKSNSPSLHVPKIPNLDSTFVTPRAQQVLDPSVPADHVDILIVRLGNSSNALSILDPHVPDPHASIGGARCENGRFRGRPL